MLSPQQEVPTPQVSVTPPPIQDRKRNNYIFIIILLLLICIGLLVALFIANKSKSTPDKEVASLVPSINSGGSCSQTNFYTIHDSSNPMVLDAENQFLSQSKISKNYFDTHFKFECAGKAQNGDHVIFRYSIGDYSTQIYLIRFTGNSNFSNDFAGLHEINNVLPKEKALTKLQSCLKAKPENINVSLQQNILSLSGSKGKYEATLNLENGNCGLWEDQSMPLIF